MSDDHDEFLAGIQREVAAQGTNTALQDATRDWFGAATAARYSYHFAAFGRPIIQFPQDMIAVQELIWQVQPDVIVETGIARGGSLVMSAGMLAVLDHCDAVQAGTPIDPRQSARRVIGVDVDIRAHNRAAIEAHPLAHYITMIQGSSVDAGIVGQVANLAAGARRVLVFLDSNHTHDHVLAELRAYAPLVTPGSYCVAFDTIVEHLPPGATGDRPWGPGNSPGSAVRAYLAEHPEFEVDAGIDNKLLISVAPGGYLKRVR
jgi:cephalosporin hydroxylase